jgi:carbon monoxide dehydrogenase subunit G
VEVKLDKRYPLAVDLERAWLVLRDIRAVSGCMPGAELTEQLSANHYKGTVKVKVGPANASFGGDVEVIETDAAARRIRLNAKGADKGGSSASMDLTASVEPGENGQSVLVGSASVVVNGKFAQFGGRLMGQVSDMILAQFAGNFAAAAGALPPPATSGAGAQAQPSAASTKARELNALALLWALIKGWFAGLFGKRTS